MNLYEVTIREPIDVADRRDWTLLVRADDMKAARRRAYRRLHRRFGSNRTVWRDRKSFRRLWEHQWTRLIEKAR